MDDKKMFLSGYAPFSHLLFCAKARGGAEELVRDGEYPFTFHLLNRKDWGEYATEFNWAPIAVASAKPEGQGRIVVAVGAHGEFYELQPSDGKQQTGVLPGTPRFLARNLAVVGDVIYAVGMGRSVARRDAPMTWTRLDPKLPANDDDAVGFNDLAAVALDEMYTVGWGGEILRTDGQRWQAVDSPVSAALRAACVGADGLVYAVGYSGTMVRGRGDDWSIVETNRQGVLLDVCAFKNEIFVATSFNVLRLTPGGLEPVSEFEDPDDRPTSCVGLCAAADGSGVFWMANTELFRITDTTWHRVA